MLHGKHNFLLKLFDQLKNDLQAQSLLLTNQRHLSLMHFSTRCNSCQCVSYMRTKVTFLFSDFILNVNRVCFPFLLHAWKIFLKWCLNKFCSASLFSLLVFLCCSIKNSFLIGCKFRQFDVQLVFIFFIILMYIYIDRYLTDSCQIREKD